MTKKRILPMAVVAMLFASCSNDDLSDVPVMDSMTDTPIAFNVGVDDLTNRAGYEAGTITSGAMGFYMQTAGTDDLDAVTASKYTGTNKKIEYKDGVWTVEDYPLLWRNKTAEVGWQAYYPYSDADVVDGILPVIVPTDQNRDGVYDLLYAKGTTTGEASSGGISVTLKHEMSKLIVNLKTGTELGAVEYDSVVIGGMNTKWSYNILKGYWNINGDLDTPANINMIKHENGTTFEAIILPIYPDQLNIDIITADGHKYYYKRGSTHFKEGQIHTLNLKIGKDKVDVENVTASNWVDNSEGTGDLVTE